MNILKKTLFGFGLILASGAASAVPIQLLSNGDFESGDFSGWNVTDAGFGSWFIDNDGSTPITNFPSVGPAGGNFYAVTDQTGAGVHVLEQSFFVPADSTSVLLAFDMFMNDQSNLGPIVSAAGLVHDADANQHGRVDIMTALAGAFSITPGDIVANLVAPSVDGGLNPNSYTSYLFDISGIVSADNSYKLRFGEVDNQLWFNMGIDNVSIIAEVNPVPAPATFLLVGLGLASMRFIRRRKI